MTFDIQRFEDTSHQNGIRYWYAHDFMRELGYESWASFNGVIHKAIASCARLGLDFHDAFINDTRNIEGKEQRTYRLSRFACLLITMHADEKKPEVAAAKFALAAIADRLITAQISQNDLGRIEIRDDLKAAENIMSAAAKFAGVETQGFGIFKDAGFRGMYDMSLADLKRVKGINSKDVAYDFMGLTELAGNLFRVTQTAEKLKSSPGVGTNLAAQTAKQVGSQVRKLMIQNSGIRPESLPAERHVDQVKKELRSTAKQMGKIDKTKVSKAKIKS
jgi:DNA-damage-inducible protein D